MLRCHEMPFGALPIAGGVRFALWAPAARRVELLLDGGAKSLPMPPGEEGWRQLEIAEAAAGSRYCYRIDGELCVPDPASRAQDDDVHGASVVVDPTAFTWPDRAWSGRPWQEAVIYELHVGSFTAQGDFAGVITRLDELVELGITAIELMPVADFPGAHDWGYDGVLPFAPDRRYGTPADLKRLVAEAHRRGLMVLLDVVYNHFGPEGNYLHLYAPQFFTERHHTPWGAAINFDGELSRWVRQFFIHNALYWLEEYHIDGLRLDAVHAIFDDSEPDILVELADAVRARFDPARHIHLVLENDRNQARYLAPPKGRGWNWYQAQWNDDVHHCLHVLLTGESDGYYDDFADNPLELLGRALAEGYAFQGEWSEHRQAPRGEPSRGLNPAAFVNFLQNHDQIGNRAFGERITALAPFEAVRAATALLLLAPQPPLLFMGQEWGSAQPFPFFCAFGPELAGAVTEGRRQEFARFAVFADPVQRERIPDPMAPETYRQALLDWERRDSAAGRQWLALHRELLALRRACIVPHIARMPAGQSAWTLFAERGLTVRWPLADGRALLLVANLGSEPVADLRTPPAPLFATPEAPGASGVLAPWGVLWFLTEGVQANAYLNDRPLFP